MNNVVNNPNANSNINIKFNGSNNLVDIGLISNTNSLTIDVRGDGNKVFIANSNRLGNLRIIVQDGSTISIGENTTVEQAYILARDGTTVEIGKDCMISFQVDIRTSDAHAIYSLDTGCRVNSSKSIKIHDHVWIGQAATISKGVVINRDSVVGYGAYVQNFIVPDNSVVAGAPAKIVKSNILWDRRSADNIYTCDDADIDPYHLRNSAILRDKRSALNT